LNYASSCAIYRAVNQRVPFFRLLALLCLTALLEAQVFGVARGYLCNCAGLPEWTTQDHCHGPHGLDCHRGETSGQSHEESDGASDRRDHEQVRDEVQSRLTASIEAPALVPILVAFFGAEVVWPMDVLPAVSVADVDVDTGPPLGVAVVRTTVLLI
jgi:hypothetical protein